MTSHPAGRAERALGAILNLIRCNPPTTIEEANDRLELIDQIALTAFTSVRKRLPVGGSGSRSSTRRYSEQKHNSISNQRHPQHGSAS